VKRKAVFFDRDGIVNYRIVGEYINQKSNFHFIPDFFRVFSRLKELGYLVILVSNQKGVGKGLMTFEELKQINEFMIQQLYEQTGESFDDVFYCTDTDVESSPRLKPNPGMIIEAIEKWNIEPSLSWMVGDSSKDILAGKRAGVKTILVGITEENFEVEPDVSVNNLLEILVLFD